MRILVVATNIKIPDTHGGSTHVGELFRNLSTHGPTHLLAAEGSHGENITGIASWLYPPSPFKHLVSLRYFPKALRAAEAFKPDVIYERGSSYGLGAMLSAKLGIPMLCMVLDEWYSPLSLIRARKVIATNTELVPAWSRSKAVKVSWGANAELFHPNYSKSDARQRWKLPNDAFVIGYSGSFQKWHGLDSLLEATHLLKDRPLHLLLVGDGRQRQAIEAQCQELGLSSRVTITGRVPYEDVAPSLAAADICVAPFNPSLHNLSKKRGFALDPLKVFEYLALNKPTITVKSRNIEELFEHGTHLRMVEPGDARGLAENIAAMMEHPADAAASAERGREVVLANHTWAAHAAHLASLFRAMR